MKPRKKDNLTDAVEALQRQGDGDSAPQAADGQVVNEEGEVVTLGQKPGAKPPSSLKLNSLELSDKDLSEIKEIISAAVQNSLDKFLKKFEKNRKNNRE